jgi:CHAT domain-containing protein
VRLTETARLDAAGSGATGGFLAARRRAYETLVEVLARLDAQQPGQGHAEEALAVSEQAHARGLLEMVGLSPEDLRQGVEPALLEQERLAAAALATASARQARLTADGQATEATLGALAESLRTASRELEEVQARVRAQSPRYAEAVRTATLDAAGVQREVGPDTLLLEYLLGRDHSALWAVDATGVTLHRLEGRERLEAVVRRLHHCWAERCPADEERRRAAEASRLLLAPVAARLGGRRLAVVADGALHYLPFAALPVPGDDRRLLGAHEVVSLPSVSTLAALRGQRAERAPAPLAVAVLADPVFEAQDARVKHAAAPKVAPAGPRATDGMLARSSHDLGLGPLVRLLATRREAVTIGALAPPGQALVALDFGASREVALGGALERYRVVHFATHGLLDNRNPGLSGLVLSLVDEGGGARDGFVRTGDVFGLTLNADLVVLSACQTALGQERLGEGLVGLTRAFLHAGATRVLASLWMVPDGATAELMRRFYRGLLEQGLPAATALSQAQRSMAREPRWSNPYHWAGFTLQGPWE